MKKHLLFLLLLILTSVAGCARPTQAPEPADLEERTLASLEKVDNYPLYVMHYYGPYVVDVTGQVSQASPQREIIVQEETPGWACSLFAALGDEQNALYGRNFDWAPSPAVLLFTHPTEATIYASVSMVDVVYLGFSQDVADALMDFTLDERRGLLQAPLIPFDGMNERGLAVGMAAVPDTELPYDPGKPTIGSVGILRTMLDYAGNVDEAVEILQGYNLEMQGGETLHYLLADASGKAVLVEFTKGEVILFPNTAPWHQATNFLVAGVADPYAQCHRYNALSARLSETGGKLTTAEALDLLKSVRQSGTQWSVVYGIHTGTVDIAMGRDYKNIHHFDLTP
ncbi:MAG: linear amide C-N hydrolase [Anaerolineae bacterium]|nr:linear amide C-N hydrolase [Anaerolineae bacterium]